MPRIIHYYENDSTSAKITFNNVSTSSSATYSGKVDTSKIDYIAYDLANTAKPAHEPEKIDFICRSVNW